MSTEMKVCDVCGVEKTLQSFRKDVRYKDNRKPACIACNNAAKREEIIDPEAEAKKLVPAKVVAKRKPRKPKKANTRYGEYRKSAPKLRDEVEKLKRRQFILDRKMAGDKLIEIQEAMVEAGFDKIDVSTVSKEVDRALKDMYAHTDRDVTKIRDMAVARCERYRRAIWSKVEDGDLPAIDRAIKIDEREAKLLGIDQSGDIMIGINNTVEIQTTPAYEGRLGSIRAEINDIENKLKNAGRNPDKDENGG